MAIETTWSDILGDILGDWEAKRSETLSDLRDAWDLLRRDAHVVAPADSQIHKDITDGVAMAGNLGVNDRETGPVNALVTYVNLRNALMTSNYQATIGRLWASPPGDVVRGIHLETDVPYRAPVRNMTQWVVARADAHNLLPLGDDLTGAVERWSIEWDHILADDAGDGPNGDNDKRFALLLDHASKQLERARVLRQQTAIVTTIPPTIVTTTPVTPVVATPVVAKKPPVLPVVLAAVAVLGLVGVVTYIAVKDDR